MLEIGDEPSEGIVSLAYPASVSAQPRQPLQTLVCLTVLQQPLCP